MGRLEFIERLAAALNGSLAPSVARDYINYYEEYIGSEMRKGRSEEDVMAALGDPRLIARTIIETNTDLGDTGEGQDSRQGGRYESGRRQTYAQEESDSLQREEKGREVISRQYRVPGWVWALVAVLAVIFVLFLFTSLLTFLAPILIPVVLIVFFVKLFKDWLK